MMAWLWKSLGAGPTGCLTGAAKSRLSVSTPPFKGGVAGAAKAVGMPEDSNLT